MNNSCVVWKVHDFMNLISQGKLGIFVLDMMIESGIFCARQNCIGAGLPYQNWVWPNNVSYTFFQQMVKGTRFSLNSFVVFCSVTALTRFGYISFSLIKLVCTQNPKSLIIMCRLYFDFLYNDLINHYRCGMLSCIQLCHWDILSAQEFDLICNSWLSVRNFE